MTEAQQQTKAGFVRRREAAQYLSVSERWLSILQRSHQVPFHKRGKIVSFKVADLDAYMQRFRVQATWEH